MRGVRLNLQPSEMKVGLRKERQLEVEGINKLEVKLGVG